MMYWRAGAQASCEGPRLEFYKEPVPLGEKPVPRTDQSRSGRSFTRRCFTWKLKPLGEMWHIILTLFNFLIMQRRHGDGSLKGQLWRTGKDRQNHVLFGVFFQHDSSNRLPPLPFCFSSTIQCISHWEFYFLLNAALTFFLICFHHFF